MGRLTEVCHDTSSKGGCMKAVLFLLGTIVLGTVVASTRGAAPADPRQEVDALTDALRTAKGADRASIAERLVVAEVRLAESLQGQGKHPAGLETLRKAKLLTSNFAPSRAQELNNQLDVRLTLAQWRQANEGRGLEAEYFRGTEFGESISRRVDPNIDFLWDLANPVENFDGDAFTARWTGFIVAPHPGDYNLIALYDDKCRVWVDDVQVIDDWKVERGQAEGIVRFTDKPQTIKVEYCDRGSHAHLSLHWALVGSKVEAVIPPEAFFTDRQAATRLAGKPEAPPKGFGLSGEYFEKEFGRLAFTRVDSAINFLWYRAYPGGMSEQFSVRWKGYLRAPKAGRYRLIICHDDGIRIAIDGKQVFNDWTNYRTDEVQVQLTGKPQSVAIEYRNAGGGASLSLAWQLADSDDKPTLIPASAFFNDPKVAQFAP
jgi:hypothetical protein